MPVNTQAPNKIEPWKPSKREKELMERLQERVDHLKDYRKKLMANPYDTSKDARTIEKTWDFAEYVSLPHKYSHPDLKKWQSKNSRPLIFAKIDTALSILFEKNPEVELSARQAIYEGKTKLLTALYDLSWDKGHGHQQLIKFIQNLCTYGFSVGREYHRYEECQINEIIDYDPALQKHKTELKTITKYNDAYFEVLPIRDVWFDDRATPYDEDSVRDWYWEKSYDYSTFLQRFGDFPNAKYVQGGYSPSAIDVKSKADIADDSTDGPVVRLGFYESLEDNEFLIKVGNVLLYEGPLVDNELSCVWGSWKMRNDFTIYGLGLPEILENDQENLDKISNMTVNQVILAIGGAGYYGGSGTVTEKDMQIEPKLKKLRDAEKIQFVKIPPPDATAFTMMEAIKNDADEVSGVTKSLGGEQVGKTLGEAVLNREAGLRRLALPLKNIQFALERHARIRLNNLQRIYSRPAQTVVVRDTLGNILDPKLWEEYQQERAQLGADNLDHINKFPDDDLTGTVFRNQYKTERLPLEKDQQGQMEFSDTDALMEITPEEIRGEYDVKVNAMSMIPLSKTLEEARALETYNILAKNPYIDLYKATSRLIKKRGEKPDDWLQTQEEIIQTQQSAMQAPSELMPETGGPQVPSAGPPTVMPQADIQQPGGMSADISQSIAL